MTKTHAACPTGRADMAKCALSRPLHSTVRRAQLHSQGALAPLVAPRVHLDAPCSAHYPNTDVRTKAAHVPPFCRCSSAPHEHARSATAPSRLLLSSLIVQPVLLLRNARL
jgi:hypothetical protein